MIPSQVPLPPASLWEKYPEVGIIVLLALVFIGAFYAFSRQEKRANEKREEANRKYQDGREEANRRYQDGREAQWQAFLEQQRQASSLALREQRELDRNVLAELIAEIKAMRVSHQAHDQFTREAVGAMRERVMIEDTLAGQKEPTKQRNPRSSRPAKE